MLVAGFMSPKAEEWSESAVDSKSAMQWEGETCRLGRVWDLVKRRESLCLIHVKVISENEGNLGNGAENWKSSKWCGQVSLTSWERSVQDPLHSFIFLLCTAEIMKVLFLYSILI